MKHQLIPKISSFILIIIIFCSIKVYSQDTSKVNSLAGKYALQFQIADNFQLTSFQGSVLSAKYHFTNSSALRLGISFYSNSDGLNEFYNYNADSLNAGQIDNTNGYVVQITIQYLYYYSFPGNINFYLGGGPLYGKSFYKDHSESIYSDTTYSSNASSNGWSVGVDLAAGVEWFFTSNMSLSAGYGLMYLYSTNIHAETQYSHTITYKFKSNNINADQVKFGLSIYF
jgi:opacity protein-like surface antigen